MSLRINFFPLHYIVALLALLFAVIVFSDTIYIYMSSSIFLNSFILLLFILCIMWQLGVLSYYSRSTRVLNKLLGVVNPSVVAARDDSDDEDDEDDDDDKIKKKRSSKKDKNQDSNPDVKKQAMYVSSSVAGTLLDSPVVSKLLSVSVKTGKIDLNSEDADVVTSHVYSNGERMLALSKFLTSLFTMLGLLGTFLGLLQTIDGVGKALGALSNIENIDILGFVKLLADPLRGMSVAFSTSLFGLVASLFGNYGNYVAQEKLNLLTVKLRNFLLASSVAMNSGNNPSGKIDAKDILMSLDDSFNRLYEGLSERLDSLADAVITMSKAIVRTQERQEKILKLMIDSLNNIEEVISSSKDIGDIVVNGFQGLGDNMKALMLENREQTYAYLDATVLKLMKKITVDIDKGTKISAGILKASSDNLELNVEGVKASVGLAKIAENGNAIASDAASAIRANLNVLSDSNVVLNDISRTVTSEWALVDEGVGYIRDIAAKMHDDSYEEYLVDIISILNEGNSYASATSASASEIARIDNMILGKVVSKDDLQSIEFLIDSSNKILEGMGGTLSTIADVVISGSSYSGYFEEALGMLSSVNSSMAMIYDSIGGVGDMMVSNNEMLSYYLNNISSSVSSLSDALYDSARVTETMGENMLFALDAMSELVNIVDSNMRILSSDFHRFTETFTYTLEVFQTNVSAIDQARLMGQQLSEGMNTLTGVLSSSIPIISDLIGSVDASSQNVGYIVASLDDLTNQSYITNESLLQMANNSYDMSNAVMEYASTSFESNRILTDIFDYMRTHVDQSSFVYEGMDQLLNQFASLREMYNEELNFLASNVSSSVDVLTNTFEYIANNIGNSAPLFDTINNVMDEFRNLGVNALSNVSNDLSAILNVQYDLLNVMENRFGGLGDQFSGIDDKFFQIIDALNLQVNSLSLIAENTAFSASYGQDLANDMGIKYSSLQDALYNLSDRFEDVSFNFDTVSNEMLKQNDIMERNLDSVASLAENIGYLSDSNAALERVGDNVSGAIAQLSEVADIIANLNQVSSILEVNLSNFTRDMSDDIKNLSMSLSSISNDALYEEARQINDNVKILANLVEDNILKSGGQGSDALLSDAVRLIEDINFGISDLKVAIAESAYKNVVSSYQSNPDEFILKLENVVRSLEDMNIRSEDQLSISSSILSLLTELKIETVDENMKMSIVANAIDSLITEMLNSRDVTENILRLISENQEK